eukprot:scaffold8509_cov119-Isochrysis_galbana.AAC.5
MTGRGLLAAVQLIAEVVRSLKRSVRAGWRTCASSMWMCTGTGYGNVAWRFGRHFQNMDGKWVIRAVIGLPAARGCGIRWARRLAAAMREEACAGRCACHAKNS